VIPLPVTGCPKFSTMMKDNMTCIRSPEGQREYEKVANEVLDSFSLVTDPAELERIEYWCSRMAPTLDDEYRECKRYMGEKVVKIDRKFMGTNGFGIHRDSFHFHLPGYTAVAEMILNHLCNVCQLNDGALERHSTFISACLSK